MLVVGAVDASNTHNIFLKNVMDASLGAIIWWTIGHGIAMGTSSDSGYFGTDMYFLTLDEFSGKGGFEYAKWLFHWALAAVTAAIATGALSERCTLFAHCVFTCCLMGVIYPVVAHAAWGPDGKASAFVSKDHGDDFDKGDFFRDCGVLDAGGSGVVHMTAGIAALMGCAVLGPRKAVAQRTFKVAAYGPIFQTIGTLILWFGWYGTAAGSTVVHGLVGFGTGFGEVAAKAMVNTTLGAACGAVGALLFGSFKDSAVAGKRVVKLKHANLGARAGLVAISAGCAVVEPWAACAVGGSAAVIFISASKLVKTCGVDDGEDRSPVRPDRGGLFQAEPALASPRCLFKCLLA